MGTGVSSSQEDSEAEADKKKEDQFEMMMEKMIQGVTLQGEENRRVMSSLLNGRAGKGKHRAPNGKLRKTAHRPLRPRRRRGR